MKIPNHTLSFNGDIEENVWEELIVHCWDKVLFKG